MASIVGNVAAEANDKPDSTVGSESVVGVAEVQAFVDKELPSMQQFGITLERLDRDESLVRFVYNDAWIRPGGEIVSGPVLMAMADFAVYTAIFTRTGIVPLAVTNELKMNFLRPAIGRDVLARGRLVKLGRRVAFGTVDLFEEHAPDRLVAHASCSYVMPDAEATQSS